jgi:hypothetical protein
VEDIGSSSDGKYYIDPMTSTYHHGDPNDDDWVSDKFTMDEEQEKEEKKKNMGKSRLGQSNPPAGLSTGQQHHVLPRPRSSQQPQEGAPPTSRPSPASRPGHEHAAFERPQGAWGHDLVRRTTRSKGGVRNGVAVPRRICRVGETSPATPTLFARGGQRCHYW